MEMRNALGLIIVLLLFDIAASISSAFSPIVIKADYDRPNTNITNSTVEYVFLYRAADVIILNESNFRSHNCIL